MLYPCSEVKNPYKGFTSCRDTAYAGSESNLNSKLLHDLKQHWFDSWREKDFLCSYKLRHQCLPSILIFSPQVTPENTSGIFSWSKGIHKCKYQPLYNQLQDPSFLKAPSQMLSLSTGLQSTTWKIVLNNQFFTAISSTSSNINMCYLMQCQPGNAASFKAAALGI